MMSEKNSKSLRPTDDYMRLQDFVSLCLHKWIWFVLSVSAFICAAILYIVHTEPVYTRTASILVKEDSKGSSGFSSAISGFADMGLFNTNTNVNNELAAIKSPALILETARRLHLDVDYAKKGRFRKETLYGSDVPVIVVPVDMDDQASCSFTLHTGIDGTISLSEFKGNGENSDTIIRAGLKDTIATPAGRVVLLPGPAYAADKEQTMLVSRSSLYDCVERCITRLSATLNSDNATIIDLTYNDVSTQRAEDFLNMLIATCNENWVKDKNQIAVSTSQFIDERLSVIERELGDVDGDISSYKSENLIPDVQAASSMYMSQANQANTQILELNNRLYMARYIRNFVSGDTGNGQLLPANSGIGSGAIEKQIAEYNETLLQRNSLVANSSAQNPLVRDADAVLESMRKSILSSIDNEISAINTSISSLRASERQSTARIASNPTQAKYLLSVERQQKVKESLYLFLLQKREENELSQAFTAYNTRLITPPMGQLKPIEPRKRKILLVALLLGLMAPAVIIFIRESANTKVRGRKDLEHLNIPLIGEIPYFGERQKFRHRHVAPMGIVVKEGSRDIINEAFRLVRTNIEFMREDENRTEVYAVTSFNPGSGKTFSTLNIAASLALKGKRVLTIDGDLRHASLSAFVDSHSPGITEYLIGRTDLVDELPVRHKDFGSMDILPIGTIPPNPSELLSSKRFPQLLDALKKKYDYIFIDCPPYELVADTQIIVKQADVDRTIFVLRAGLLDKDMLKDLDDIYENKKLKNLSMLLNATLNIGGRYAYRYGYHNGYYNSGHKA